MKTHAITLQQQQQPRNITT